MNYTIANGETLEDITFGNGDIVTVQNGGTLSNVIIPKSVTSVTLENGAILNGGISTAKFITVSGSVNASSADLDLNISTRTPEDGLFLNSLFETQSISVTISTTDQDKGTYRLFGNAAEFSGTITIENSLGAILGTLSIEDNVLNYDITRYTLSLNEANEVCVTVSSNIPDTSDYVLLYKNNVLVASLQSADGLTISADGEYDHMIVLNGGVATNCVLASDGLLTVMAGGVVTDLDQQGDGALRFDYTTDDTTVITGTNKFTSENNPTGAFSVSGNTLSNVYGEKVNVNGNVVVKDYYLSKMLAVGNGVALSGTLNNKDDSRLVFNTGSMVHDLTVVSGSWSDLVINVGVIIEDSVLNCTNGYGGLRIEQGATIRNTTISIPGNAWLTGGTYSNVTMSRAMSPDTGNFTVGNISLAGSLTMKSPITDYQGVIDANGNTIILDYTERTVDDIALIAIDHISEDAKFQINMTGNQKTGTYAVATGAGNFVDTFKVKIDDTILDGTISVSNPSLTYDNKTYTMALDAETQTLYLTVDISPDADSSFNVLYWDKDGNFYHTASLSGVTIGSSAYDTVIVRNGGILTDATLLDGALLTVQAGGQVTGLDQQGNGKLRFDYTAGDTTVITGTNQYGEFSVSNDVMSNVYGENVSAEAKKCPAFSASMKSRCFRVIVTSRSLRIRSATVFSM